MYSIVENMNSIGKICTYSLVEKAQYSGKYGLDIGKHEQYSGKYLQYS
jgi:hypothetical protein